MKRNGRFSGVLTYLAVHWPLYLAVCGGGALLLLVVMAASVQMGWWGFVPLSLALFLLLGYFGGASLWAAHKIFDPGQSPDYDRLFALSNLRPQDHFIHLHLGQRYTIARLARHLTSGRIIVVDLYHPQQTPSRSLRRWRSHRDRAARSDPRLIWRDGRLDLLPVPDNSALAVILCRAAGEFWQHGDRLCLLQEIHRVLAPGGRLLLSERVRSRTNLLVMGPAVLALPPALYWRDLLREAGFQVSKEQSLHDLVHCYRADKPAPERARQLLLDF
jgi:SAM-dependent methyltransferase